MFPCLFLQVHPDSQESLFLRDFFMVVGSYPNFTPVRTTKLGAIANYIGEFEKRGVKLLSLSSDEVGAHKACLPDVEACTPGSKVTYPILVVPKAEIMVKLNRLDPDEKDEIGMPLASSSLHIVGPDKKERSHKPIKYADLLQKHFDQLATLKT
ncbi:hypothetical protein SUGI_0752900 [Cryptomeria japonica]|nr:hypothetical protein SUGI_0752900 [Cryptomeria japonica]